MPLPLRDLMRVLAVAEHGSVSDAARALHIAQPALSKIVRTSEEYLGIQLFERTHKGVTLTAQGEVLMARARAIRAEVGRVERDVQDIRKGRFRQVRIGIEPVHPIDLLMQSLVEAGREHPDIRFCMTVDPMTRLMASLREGAIDFIFGPLPERTLPLGFAEQPVYYEELIVVCGRRSPLFGLRSVKPEALAQQPWVVGPDDSFSGVRLRELAQALQLGSPTVMLEFETVPARRAAVELSDMLSVFQRAQILQPLAARTLAVVPVRWTHFNHPIGTIRPIASHNPVHDTLVKSMISVFSKAGLKVKP